MSYTLSSIEEKLLGEISRSPSSKKCHSERAKIVLNYHSGESKSSISRSLDSSWFYPHRWVNRWKEEEDSLSLLESRYLSGELSEKKYRSSIVALLSDKARSGAPKRITEAEKAQIIALSSSNPEDLGLPFTHWSHRLLSKEVANRGIRSSISPSYLGKILKNAPTSSSQK